MEIDWGNCIKMPECINNTNEINEKFIKQFNTVCNNSDNPTEMMWLVISLLNEYREMQAKIFDFSRRTVPLSPSFMQNVDTQCFLEIQKAVNMFNGSYINLIDGGK